MQSSRQLKIDRIDSYFERVYSLADVQKRVVVPSGCSKDDYLTLRSGAFVKAIHGKIMPAGMLTVFEFLLARFFMFSTKSTSNPDAIILKLKKYSIINRNIFF